MGVSGEPQPLTLCELGIITNSQMRNLRHREVKLTHYSIELGPHTWMSQPFNTKAFHLSQLLRLHKFPFS